MRVIDFYGTHNVENLAELQEVLQNRFEESVNSFQLSNGDSDYPVLLILVNRELATACFFPAESNPGYRSIGNLKHPLNGDTSVFQVNSNGADELHVLNEAVISFADALQLAKEFYLSNSLPQSIEWFEL